MGNNISNKIVDTIFIKYFLIVYFLYTMSLKTLIPQGGMISAVINLLMLFFVVYATIIRNKYNSKFIGIYVYLAFIAVLIIIQSSDYQFSLTNFIKYSLSVLCLPIGFNVFSSLSKFRNFQKTGLIILVLYIVNIILANLLNWGSSLGYGAEGALQIGNVFTDGLYANVYIITSVFLILLLYPKKQYYILALCAVCALLIVANMKRMSIYALAVGLIVYLVHQVYTFGVKTMIFRFQKKYIIRLILVSLLALPFIINSIAINYNQRQSTFEKAHEDITQEGRMQELIYITDDIIGSNNPLKTLFGKETFNTVGTYANGRFGIRPIHGDFSVLINGTGIIGTVATLIMYLYLVYWIFEMRRKVRLKETPYSMVLFSLFFAFLTIRPLTMSTGAMFNVISSCYFFASIGGILRYFYNRNRLYTYIVNKNNTNDSNSY